MVEAVKRSEDEEQFIAVIEDKNINLSKNFLESLYGTIKQKLPQKQEHNLY